MNFELATTSEYLVNEVLDMLIGQNLTRLDNLVKVSWGGRLAVWLGVSYFLGRTFHWLKTWSW
jgi:hypothetical protein